MLQAHLLVIIINNIDDNKSLKNIGLVFEAAVAYLSRESWQLWSGVFCAVGAVLASRSRRFHAEHKYKLKKPVKSKLKGSENVQHLYLFYCLHLFCFH